MQDQVIQERKKTHCSSCCTAHCMQSIPQNLVERRHQDSRLKGMNSSMFTPSLISKHDQVVDVSWARPSPTQRQLSNPSRCFRNLVGFYPRKDDGLVWRRARSAVKCVAWKGKENPVTTLLFTSQKWQFT